MFGKVNDAAGTVKATMVFFCIFLLFMMFQFACVGFIVYGKWKRERPTLCK